MPWHPIRLSVLPVVIVAVTTSCATNVVKNQSVAIGDTPSNYAPQKFDQKNTETNQSSAEFHFGMAQAYSVEGQTDKAIEEYKLALVFDPESGILNAKLAGEYVKKGMQSAAIDACKESLKHDHRLIDVRMMLAGLYSAAGDHSSALKEYERVLALEPSSEEAAMYRAQVLFEGERGPEAVKFLRSFIAHAGAHSAAVHYYLGRIEAQLNHFNEAESAFKKAIQLNEGFTQSSLALGFLYESKQKNPKAIEIYLDLWRRNRDLAAANRLATLYLKDSKFKEAIPFLEGVQQLDPDDLNNRVKLGLVYMEIKDYDKSVPVFKSILDKNPESDRVRYYLGSLYEELKQLDLAVKEFLLVMPDSKHFTDSVLHASFILKQTGKPSEARRVLTDSIEKSPKVASFYLMKATLEEDEGRVSDAVKTLEVSVEYFPEDEKLRYYLGNLYDKRGEIKKSLAAMEEILKINPDNADALNYIGYTWTVQGIRLEDAEKLLKHAKIIKPDNAYIQDSWGWYLFIRGRLNESLVELEKAVRMKPEEATILDHLGDVYARANFREKALSNYQKALRFAQDGKLKQTLQEKLDRVSTPSTSASRLPAGN